jgi:hypothetical protein
MSTVVRRLGMAVVTAAILAAEFCIPAAASAAKDHGRTTVEYAARSHYRIRSYGAYPDGQYFGWHFGPGIDWYLANGYVGPYSYYWDDDCPLRKRVVVTGRGRHVERLVHVCYGARN